MLDRSPRSAAFPSKTSSPGPGSSGARSVTGAFAGVVLALVSCATSPPARSPPGVSESCERHAQHVCDALAKNYYSRATCLQRQAADCASYCLTYADGICREWARCGPPAAACVAEQGFYCAQHPEAFDVLHQSCR